MVQQIGDHMDNRNAAQKILCDTYNDGSFADVRTREDAGHVGDTLFTFLFIELSDSEGVANVDEAIYRVSRAQQDLEAVHAALIKADV
jgi:hypothetical protein